MFTGFEQRGRRRPRRGGVAVASVAAHALVAWLAAVASVRANDAPPSPPSADTIIWVAPTPRATRPVGERPARPRGTPRAGTGSSPAWRAAPLVPELLPAIDVDAAHAPDPLRDALAGDVFGAAASAPGGPGAGAADEGPWPSTAVEVEARPRPGNPAPRYPAALEATRVAGTVTARFVVDTLGRVEPGSVRLAGSDDPRFADAVRRVLPRHRFHPARVGGRAVRQLVEQPFVFAVRP